MAFSTFYNVFYIVDFFAGAVHATDFSNASATGIFDSYQVSYCIGVIAIILSAVAVTFGDHRDCSNSVFI